MNTTHLPTTSRVLTGLLFATALILPGAADAKRKADYSDKTYGGKIIEEYCSDLLGVETFDLSEADLERCDKQYSEQVDALDDFSVGDIDLKRAPGEPDPEGEDEPDPDEPRLSKKEQEELEAKKAEEEKERLAGLGLVEFDEGPVDGDEGDDDEEEDDPLADDELDEPGLGDEEVEVFDGEDDMVIDGDFGGGGSGSSLEDLDDFGDEDEGGDRKKKKDKKKKDKKKKDKKKDKDSRFDDATDLPDFRP